MGLATSREEHDTGGPDVESMNELQLFGGQQAPVAFRKRSQQASDGRTGFGEARRQAHACPFGKGDEEVVDRQQSARRRGEWRGVDSRAMSSSAIDYAALVRRALRGVVREALALAARGGLPGENHFYLSFSTCADGVELPRAMRDLHPERLTIILQHQFWDLEVDEVRFAVTLSFGGQRQRIAVPFSAVEAFADPAAGLELRFDETATEHVADPRDGVDEITPAPGNGDSPTSNAGSGGEILPFSRPRRR